MLGVTLEKEAGCKMKGSGGKSRHDRQLSGERGGGGGGSFISFPQVISCPFAFRKAA